MYVLQECSICLQDYDAERSPHCVPCGHVFCGECLYSALDLSDRCPVCRQMCVAEEVRKVICTLHEVPAPAVVPGEENAEEALWQSINRSIEPNSGLEQRRAVLDNELEPVLRGSGMTQNLTTALNLMKLLVKSEQRNVMLESQLEASRVGEQGLRHEAQEVKPESNPSRGRKGHRKNASSSSSTRAVALYDFTGISDQELTVTAGTTLRLGSCSKFEDGYDWVYCKTDEGAKGFIPKSYVAGA